MVRRVKLQELLEYVINCRHELTWSETGIEWDEANIPWDSFDRKVYFQPPENVKLIYPCIVYERSSEKPLFANDNPYINRTAYKVTVIDRDPDSDILERIAALPMCKFDRHYTANNLNHDVYNLYY